MQKILRKRVLRDLKENIWRYLALSALIILGMYLIVSLVAAADTVITGTKEHSYKNQVEDGEFSVFVPLTRQKEKKLAEKGAILERMFYLDMAQEDTSVLRIFKNREQINLLELDHGRQANANHEVVLEKRYCQEHKIQVGDSIVIAEENFIVTGIGSVPDYEGMYRNLSDSTVDSKEFGIAFVTQSQYVKIKESGKSNQSEQYQYAYRLNTTYTDKELKAELEKLKVSPDQVSDPYFQQYWKETEDKKDEIMDGITELADGSQELSDGLGELEKNKEKLNKGANQIFKLYLTQMNAGLKEYGMSEELTEENYKSVLTSMYEESSNGILRLELHSLLTKLNELKEYKDGITEYTKATSDAAEGSEKLNDGVQKLQDETSELIEKYFTVTMPNLTSFMEADQNPRIEAGAKDQKINQIGGLVSGVIVMILFTYVISVFVIHGIEKESSVIGTLYALGAKKNDLMLHYLMLPVLVTFFASLIGTALGFSKLGVNNQLQDSYDYFSLPIFQITYAPYLVIYSLLMPVLVAIVVNCLVIQKKLSQPVLVLIRNEQKRTNISNLKLGNMGFVTKFRIRQMIREMRTGFAVIFGMFISLLIMMLGIDCYVMCHHISIDNKNDTKYEYMYSYKYPDKEVPSGGEAGFAKTLKKEIYGYNLDVTLLGIDDQMPYFDVKTTNQKNEVVISSAMAQKYSVEVGDSIILSDEENDVDYAFRITGITQYSVGFYAFMDITSMRELFGEEDGYYNVVFSDHDLEIESGKLYATTTKKEIENASDVFVRMMKSMIYMLCGVSAIIFCVVMYLMMKVMIDRSAFHISLMKIFGYRMGEIRKLYLNGNFYMIAFGAAICIPLAKKAMDVIYPFMISNVSCGMNLSFTWQLYLGIYSTVIVLYLVINRVLVGRLKKMVPAEVLKNRE